MTPNKAPESIGSEQEFAACAFCEFIESEMEEHELEAQEYHIYRFHMFIAHGMTV